MPSLEDRVILRELMCVTGVRTGLFRTFTTIHTTATTEKWHNVVGSYHTPQNFILLFLYSCIIFSIFRGRTPNFPQLKQVKTGDSAPREQNSVSAPDTTATNTKLA